MNRDWQTEAARVDWDAICEEVVDKIGMLRMAWEASERDTSPELHAQLVRDLYGPAFELLALFCSYVDVEEEEP